VAGVEHRRAVAVVVEQRRVLDRPPRRSRGQADTSGATTRKVVAG